MFAEDGIEGDIRLFTEGAVAAQDIPRGIRQPRGTAGFAALPAFDHGAAQLPFQRGEDLAPLAVGDAHVAASVRKRTEILRQLQQLMDARPVIQQLHISY